jgi:hypothetical protein
MTDFLIVFNPFVTAADIASAGGNLANAGGRLLQAWSGPTLLAEGDADAQSAVRASPGVLLATESPIPNIEWMGLPRDVVSVLGAWNLGRTPEYSAAVNGFLNLGMPGDGFLTPGGCVRMSSAVDEGLHAVAGLFGALPVTWARRSLRYPDRRALVGDIGVAILLIDGPDGTEAAFSADDTMGALAAVNLGLRELQNQAPAAARLVFHPFLWGTKLTGLAPASIPRPADPREPTGAEFDTIEAVWRDKALEQLRTVPGLQGLRAGRDGFRDLVKKTPFPFSVDWGYVLVITKYRAAYAAYAGTDVIISHLMWQEFRAAHHVDALPVVIAHETGHLTGARDEYLKSGCSTLERCGWSNSVNGNCEVPPFGNESCIMHSGTYVPCPYTVKHFGWGDDDGDGLLDPYDENYVIPEI